MRNGSVSLVPVTSAASQSGILFGQHMGRDGQEGALSWSESPGERWACSTPPGPFQPAALSPEEQCTMLALSRHQLQTCWGMELPVFQGDLSSGLALASKHLRGVVLRADGTEEVLAPW